MQFQFGTPPTSGRYDVVFKSGLRSFEDILQVRTNGTCEVKKKCDTGSYTIKNIVQYLGPLPDPLPEPMKPFRRFSVTHSDGRQGTGAYCPEIDKGSVSYFIRWGNHSRCYRYFACEIKNLTFDWIDEEPND